MIVKLLTEHHLEFLSFKWGCRGSFEVTLVKMSNCWKSHAAAQIELNKIEIHFPSFMTNEVYNLNCFYINFGSLYYNQYGPRSDLTPYAFSFWIICQTVFCSFLFVLIWFFTSQSTSFQLCRDRSSWVEPVLSRGHNTVPPVRLQPRSLESSPLPMSHYATVKTLMKWRIWRHFISVYTVC